jgi:hypothetical protein
MLESGDLGEGIMGDVQFFEVGELVEARDCG